MCKGFEEHCSKTQNAVSEDKEMKNRDLGHHRCFFGGLRTLKIPGTIFTYYPNDLGITGLDLIAILSKD
jgi:hypothetical protein